MSETSLRVLVGSVDRYEKRGRQVSINFDTYGDTASTTVTGCSWADDDTVFTATIVGSSARSPEDALLDEVIVTVGNVVEGVGFDVLAYAPSGSTGSFIVHVVGV